MLFGAAYPSTLGVHGVLDVQAHAAGVQQTADQISRILAIPGFQVDRDRHVDRGDDRTDRLNHLREALAFVISRAPRVGQRMTADRQRREPGLDSRLCRPRVPHRGQYERVMPGMQLRQGLGSGD